jgi:hypothetical protein
MRSHSDFSRFSTWVLPAAIVAAVASTIGGCQAGTPDAAENTANSSQAVCSATSAGSTQTVTFSTAKACDQNADGSAESCPVSGLTLTATTRVDQVAGVANTQVTILRGETPALTKTVRVANGTTSIDLELGPLAKGVHRFSAAYDGKTVTGTADGRALVPLDPAHPDGNALKFADDHSAPELGLPPDVESAIPRLIDDAIADTRTACGGAAGPSVLSALHDALSPEISQGSGGTAANLPGAPSTTTAVAGGAPGTTPDPASGYRVLDFSTPTLNGAASPVPFKDQQNTPVSFETPSCTSCQASCATSPSSYLVPFGLWACMGECWIPGHGCAQVLCGGNSCDNGESCCGSGCCGPGSVCGNTTLAECCPSDHPVGCGDQTAMWCFPAGSTCCGNLTQACPAGSVCTNVTGTTATCCQAGHVASDGACCQDQPCGGQCCDGGTCLNGTTCCYGPVSSSGTCCGYGENVCNGQCCNGTCAGDGSCIPYGSSTFNQMGRLSSEGATAEYLFPGQTLYSDGGIGGGETASGCGFLLVMQHDGNLVLYGSQAWWATNTWNTQTQDLNYAVLQNDGNFVEYAFAGNALWSSGSYDYSDEDVVMQGDGNLVVYRADGSVPFATTGQSWLKTPITLGTDGNCANPNGYPLISETTIMEANADRPGGDYNFVGSPDKVNCANLCAQDRANCLAYSWVPAGAAGNSGPLCAMKNSVPGKVADGRGVVTGYIRGRQLGPAYIPR